MRKILIGVGAVVAILIAAALLVPSFIDWNAHKGRIEAEVEAATGRKLTIAGNVGLSVLPSPTLRVREVRFANAPGAAVPEMVTLKALEVDVAFLPLLTRTIQVTRVTLVEPVIELQAGADGRGNWELGKPAAPSTPGASATPAPSSSSSSLPVRLDDVRIENGTLVWRDGAGGVQRIEKINLRASADSLQGPFKLDGTMALRGTAATIDAAVGLLSPEGSVPVRATIGLKDAKARAVLVATLGPEAPARKIDGTLKVEADSIAAAVAAVTGATGGAPAAPLALDARFSVAGQRALVEPFSITLGDTAMTGKVEAVPDRAGKTQIAATLRAPRLDIDRWTALASGVPAPTKPASPPAKTDASPPAAAAAAAFALPAGVNARVDILVETVIAKGESVRNAALIARLADGKLTIERAGGQFAGPSEVTLSGTLQAVQGKPQFDGRLQANAQSLRALLAAYKALPEGIPAQKLGRMTLQTRIKADDRQVEIQDLALTLDGMKVAGAATARLGGRPAVGARVTVDRLDVDSYMAAASAGQRAPPAAAAPAAAVTAKPPAGGFDPGVDLDIDARVGLLTARGHTARDVVMAGVLQGGALTLRQVSVADYAGATAKIAGAVRNLGPAPTVDLTIEASGRDLGRLMSQGGGAPPAQVQQPFQVNGSLKGDAGKIAVDLTARLADGQAKIAGTVEPARAPQGVALTVDVSHPSTGRLLSQLSPGYRAQGGDIGPFRLAARTRAEGQTLFLDGFSLQAGATRIEGPVRIETGGPRTKIVADLQGTEIAIDPFLPVQERASLEPEPEPYGRPGVIPAQARTAQGTPRPAAPAERWSRQPLDLSALLGNDADVKLRAASYKQGRWVVTRPDIVLALADGTLTLSKFTGQVFGGDIAITASLAARGTPTLKLDLSAKDVNVAQAVDTGRVIRLVGGKAQAKLAIQAAGRSMHDLVNALGGNASLDVRDGTLRGLNLGAAARSLTSSDVSKLPNLLSLAQDLGKDGDTQFSSLTGTFKIERGVVRSDDIKMLATGFTATGVTTTSLPVWTTQTRIEAQIATQPNPVPIGVRIEGSLDDPKKVFETNALQAYLAERIGGGRLQQLLPGLGGQTQPAAPGQPQQQRRNPLDLINPLIRR